VHAEIGLFQLRIAAALEAAKSAGIGLAAAAVLGLTGFGVLMAGVVMVLATVMQAWIAALAVGGGLIVIAAILIAVEVRVLTRGVNEALSPVEELGHGK